MNPNKLYADAVAAKAGLGIGITLVLPNLWKRPPGFPRGELLSETERGSVYSFDPDKIIRWLEKNELINRQTPPNKTEE